MAMTISVASDSGSAPNTPQSTGSPQTPLSPANAVQTLALPPPVESTPAATGNNNASTNGTSAQPKRKPSRRANTAERRATHNAVERQRRETLNGRFLDLAALLPNLSQIRRPSKSSIVNSSIAHIHASRRHRLLAARELRLLKLETDALRRELNEWRDRSGLPRVEEPVRGDAFQMILSGEVEVINPGPIEEEDGNGDYAGDDFGDDDFPPPPSANSNGQDIDDNGLAATALLKNGGSDMTPFAHNVPSNGHGLHLQTILPRPSNHGAPSPMIVQSPTNVSFENPAMTSMYEPHPHPSMHGGNGSFYLGGGPNHGPMHVDKVAAWNAHMYALGQGAQQQFTPPTSSHGMNAGGSSPINVPSPQHQQAYLMNLQRQQQGMMMPPSGHHGHMYGSPVDGDDASSVGSAHGSGITMTNNTSAVRRERSGSMNSVGSGSSPMGSFEMPGVLGGGVNVPRRMSGSMGGMGGVWDESMGMGAGGGMMSGMGGMNGMSGMMKGAGAPPISVGGGGNAHGFAAMMM